MDEIRESLKGVIRELYGIVFEPEVTEAPEAVEADFSSNVALKLAKELHKSPMEIASELNANLTSFKSSVSAPGFINFALSDEYLEDEMGEAAGDFESYIRDREFEGKTVVCEFSDPNPFKVLHVGHLYTSVVGDAIARLYEYARARVVRANFGGDVGLHVAKTMYVLRQKAVDKLEIEDIAKCYVEGTVAYEEDEKAHAEITELNKEIYRINAEDMHGTELSDLYWKARELSYEYFKEFYARIGVKFDKYYPESTVAGLGLKTVLEQLDKGVYEKSEGAVVFDGGKYGLHTRVFVNKEGVPTYETKDVGLIFTKWEDWHFDRSVVITGSEQLEYMKVVLKSVEQYAPELVEKTRHLTHGLVKLSGGVKMSSRKGNFLKAVDVLSTVAEELKTQYNSEDEKVSLAATKYAFLKYKMGGDIIFDPKESVKMTGNSGPYLLYSAVRAKKVLGKVTKPVFSQSGLDFSSTSYAGQPAEPSLRDEPVGGVRNIGVEKSNPEMTAKKQVLVTSDEHALMTKLIEYKDVLREAVGEMAPHKVAGYLYELAQEFSRFYENCPVVGDEREAERAVLVRAYLNVMTHGLEKILGIKIPEEM